MKYTLLIILPVLFFWFNQYRGDGNQGGLTGGALVGVIAFAATQSPVVAGAMGLAYFLGELPGWGRWLRTVPFWNEDVSYYEYEEKLRQPERGKIIHTIADWMAPEEADWVSYAQTALVIRGLIWWVPVGIASMSPAMPIVALGALMPLCYELAYKTHGEHYWPWGERYYGIVHGIILAVLLIIR